MSLVSSRWPGRAAVALLALLPSTAWAQSGGFAIDRFDPAERGSDWFAADSLDLRGHGRLLLVLRITVENGKIVEIDTVADPARLEELEFAVLDRQ